jgi:hypothetical protein
MRTAKVSFTVEVPEEVKNYSTQELYDWIRFECGDTFGLSGKNPFIECGDIEIVSGTFYIDEF